ncbi:MAG: hypothetical protein KAJ18_03075 [Candidatus Omnitrophica bacterium]|nr:hypothetical protein [Candidatus Omnitrophota bacterium]
MQKISLAQQKIFMFMSIGVGIVLIVLLFIYLPGQGVIGRLKDEMKGIESQIQQIESVIDQKKTIKEALQDIANQYDGLERKFPKREEDALRLMNDLARELKIEIQNTRTQRKTLFLDENNQQVVMEGRRCYKVLVSMKLKSNYSTIIKYLERLKIDLPVYLTVEKLNIRKSSAPGKTLDVHLELNVYLLS